ncbi:MAG: L-lactate dehydrogenase [Sandaracinaceae bacterium]|nr:L-lactate dehydrogenase [Sandaracinaceae bacterium]
MAPANVSDYRELARLRLPRQLFDYIDGGAYEERTMSENVAALQRMRLRQRVLRDVSDIDLSVEVLGRRWALPVALAPLGLAGMFAKRAEADAARAATDAGVPFCESTVSICSVEEVRGATDGPLWFQLYVMRDRAYAESLMARAQAAGCEVLVVTVDLAVVGARYRDTRNGMITSVSMGGRLARAWDIASHPGWVLDVALGGRPLTFGNLEDAVPGARTPQDFRGWVDAQFDPSVTWDDLAWVRAHWPGKVVLKGILDPEDARRAVAVGADAIVVSNHGGRQLDGVSSTADALPRVVEVVGGELPVLVDGGIRSGLDVVKMLSLGATACLIGRAWAYAVAGGGQAGVRHMLQVIEDEMRVAMALTGNASLAELGPQTIER